MGAAKALLLSGIFIPGLDEATSRCGRLGLFSE